MDQMQAQASDLRSLASLKPTPERLATITAALDSKFEGIQSVALQVLGQWGGMESVDLLRDFLSRAVTRDYGWSIRGVAVRALARHLRPTDAEWVLKKELRNGDWMNRQAAVKAIGNMPFPDRSQLIYPLLDDPNKEVRRSARAMAGQGARSDRPHARSGGVDRS